MPEAVTIYWKGEPIEAFEGQSVAAAILNSGVAEFREDHAGHSRGPICGMGSCMECRATVDGVPYLRTCLVPVTSGMRVEPADGT
ncbi:MAG: Hydrogen cyanide synthase subunit HcnA [Fimbriimonadaceae bacterium]|nr:Hydrogen cyanide synthase subunit HcnA [Fimbriimonadaceae bacterium]